jgi:hypothetical protein
MEKIGVIKNVENIGWVIEYQTGQSLIDKMRGLPDETNGISETIHVPILRKIVEKNQDWFNSLLITKREPHKMFEVVDGHGLIDLSNLFDITELNYQLGLYVGEHIVMKYLPNLSTDSIKGNIVIDVTPEEAAKHERLNHEWYSHYMADDSKIRFKALRDYADSLAMKYLKPELKVMVPKVYPINMDNFRKGIHQSIWDCDRSHYLLDDDFFEQTMDGAWCSYIKLKLSINPYIVK